jgi:hypothetical protein
VYTSCPTFQRKELVCATDTSICNDNVTTLLRRVGHSVFEHVELISPGSRVAFDKLHIASYISHSQHNIDDLATRQETHGDSSASISFPFFSLMSPKVTNALMQTEVSLVALQYFVWAKSPRLPSIGECADVAFSEAIGTFSSTQLVVGIASHLANLSSTDLR